MTETPVQPKKQSNALGFIILIGLLVGAVVGVKSCLFDSHTTYDAWASDFTVMNPSDLAVTTKVTNTGKEAGTPSCQVEAHDPSYTYTGDDIASLTDPVQPGATVTAVMHLSISGAGAAYITNVTVKCS